jgi:hypothetical protein
MKWPGHILSAVPFAVLGQWHIAAGCLAPDVSWVPSEVAYRLSPVKRWVDWIETQPESHWRLILYRLCHTTFMPILLALWDWQFAAGYALHLLLDLVTHRGRMRQMIFYPLTLWQWPERWTLWSNT